MEESLEKAYTSVSRVHQAIFMKAQKVVRLGKMSLDKDRLRWEEISLD